MVGYEGKGETCLFGKPRIADKVIRRMLFTGESVAQFNACAATPFAVP
jgi:hypothetical protein